MVSNSETPGEKTIRRFYEAKLAGRLMHLGQMAQDRALLQRGVRKMQDGTLYQPGEPEDDEMNIRIGDDVHHHHPAPAEAQPSLVESSMVGSGWLKKAAVAAALVAGGAGAGAVPWLLSGDTPTQPEPVVQSQPNPELQYILRFSD